MSPFENVLACVLSVPKPFAQVDVFNVLFGHLSVNIVFISAIPSKSGPNVESAEGLVQT